MQLTKYPLRLTADYVIHVRVKSFPPKKNESIVNFTRTVVDLKVEASMVINNYVISGR